MLDLGWGEILVIAIVLILVVGPKDLPRVLRGFGRTMNKVRAMAGEFRSQFDEALKEAELDEVRKTVSDARKLNPTKDLRDAMNPLRKAGEELKSDLDRTMRPKTTEQSSQTPAVDASPDEPASASPAAPAAPSAAAVAKVTSSPARSNSANGAAHAAPTGAVSRKPLPEVPPVAVDAKPKTPAARQKAPLAGETAAAATPKPAPVRKSAAAATGKAAPKPAGAKVGTAKTSAAKPRAAKAGDE
jgi:sec-independent protein translocase protein TatB